MEIRYPDHKNITITDGCYAAQWSLTDFYTDSEQKLMEALASGEDFCTSWGCKKEIDYAAIARTNGSTYINVTCYMDDLNESDDLIYDALYEVFQKEDELPEELIESIRDQALWSDISSSVDFDDNLPGDASFADIVEAINRLEEAAHEALHEMFNYLCDITKIEYESYYNLTSSSTDDTINQKEESSNGES